MISQWDIISHIDPKTSVLHYFLVIDGTEHDARLIASKLKKYVQAPVPAPAPYVYSFPLPMDLDEDSQHKIRTLVQEGIEQAKKVNEFMPGGSFGNQLYKPGTEKEDQAFPTFITLDPSESFFQNDDTHGKTVAVSSPVPDIERFDQKSIDLSSLDLPTPDIIHTNHVVPTAKTTNTLPPPPPSNEISLTLRPQSSIFKQTETASAAEKTTDIPLPTQDETTHVAQIDLSFHNKTPLPAAPSTKITEDELERVFAEPAAKPEPVTTSAAEPVSATQPVPPSAESSATEPKTEPNAAPAAANAGSTPIFAQPIDDIFLAETKYDMFVDFEKLDAQAAAKKAAQQQSQTPPEEAKASKAAEFNIFEQKIKDQTCFIDVSDVAAVTQNITQKDLNFVQHATVDAASAAALESIPTPQVHINPGTPTAPAKTEDSDEVMDPFEALLASAQPKQPAAPSVESTVSSAPSPTQNTDSAQPKIVEEISTLKQENRENESMTENTGEPKQSFHLKRKIQEPQPPTPAVPPPAPVPPKPATPAAPLPKPQPMPAAPQPQPQQEAQPEEEVHHTVLRRRRMMSTPLDKTTTIDHSIEIPLSELQKQNWPLEVPLIPTYTLENMLISVNRFAHATAISVIDNPGKLYNPLVLHGISSTGKTHFLHAIGYALSKKYGQENVFITNGVRLSRGIQRYIMEGNIQQFEQFTSNIKALLIDDIHLISINEQNRAHLSKLLNDFRSQHKQIVITSKYPPENLAKLEELLHFKLDSGWISELKQAHGPSRMKIIQKMLLSNSINITNEEANTFFGKDYMSLGTVVRTIRRAHVLEKLLQDSHAPGNHSVLSMFNQLLAVKGEDTSSLISQTAITDITSALVHGNGEWGRIGFFYPQNQSHMMDWLVWAIQQRAKELGIPGGPELAIRSSYSTENIISSAFKIANLCDNKKLKGAVILGPSEGECDPSVRENFYDIITHMLEVMLIRCGVINFEEATTPSTYAKVLAELLR